MNPEGPHVPDVEEETPVLVEGVEVDAVVDASDLSAHMQYEAMPEVPVAAKAEVSHERILEFEESLFARSLDQINTSAQQAYKRRESGIAIREDEVNAIANAKRKWWYKRFGFPYSDQKRRMQLLRKQHGLSMQLERRDAANKESSPKEEQMPRAERYAAIARRMRIDLLQRNTSNEGSYNYWKKRLKQDPLLFGDAKNISSESVAKLLKSEKWIARRAEAMYALAKRLSDIDEREDYPDAEKEGRQTVFYDRETEAPYVEGRDGARHVLSPEEIAIDLDWGNRYRPDESVPDRLWRRIRKRSDIAEARRSIGVIDNEELAQIEKLSLPTTAITGEWIAEHFEADNLSFPGIVAERMAKNVLKRRVLRDPELDFTVEDSNAVEDAVLKYDFSVVRRNRRGIATEPQGLSREEYVEEKRKLGVQFTVSAHSSKINQKIHQIEEAKAIANSEVMQKYTKSRVEDIVLVSLKLNASVRYQRWLDEGKPPGGPERYMDDAEIEDLVSRVTAGMPASPDEEDVQVTEELIEMPTMDDVPGSDEDTE
ncbi:MAG TPA: hypothetical protein VLB83_04915 [Candidatus Paceibacterota bacterium]|nr:hypothetical protein [Candidatus Paceibacterota bacterium]